MADERKAAIHREEDVLKIYKMLDPRPKELLLSQRRFIKGGPIKTFNTKERRKKPRFFFLFNDVLLIVKKEGKTKYWLKTYIRLRGELTVEDMQTKLVPNVEFRLSVPKKTLIFFADNEQKKAEWVKLIQDAIDGKYDPDKELVETHTVETVVKEVHTHSEAPAAAPSAPSEPQVVKEVVTNEVFQFGPGMEVSEEDLNLDDIDLDDELLASIEGRDF
eukprot:TRINITY_DN21675_c0_g1_i1.p2 TRINITY_DN21675_c0_g1~~TRINITY_DN21675_c0_g1_i1.p2  ORF type:complete len:237 (+),score=107.40 TRINITY_DN21675_c0_g1_i1:58-711(+)